MDEEPIDLPNAIFPAPPTFWKHFTSTNVKRFKEIDSQDQAGPLPYEAQILRAPAPPTQPSSYRLFYKHDHAPPVPTLVPAHDETLFDPEKLMQASGTARPHARLLWQLTKSLNLNFLELYTIMGEEPLEGKDKMADIGTLIENINAVINLLRPHQAREQVKTMLVNRLEDGKEEMNRCDEAKTEIEQFLSRVEADSKTDEVESHFDNGANGVNDTGDGAKKAVIDQARIMWESLNSLEGD